MVTNPDSASISFRVGARVGWWHTSYPFGCLTATREQIQITALLGNTVVDRARIHFVTREPFFGRKVITFRTHDSSAKWVFVYAGRRSGEILDALETLDWPVDDRA